MKPTLHTPAASVFGDHRAAEGTGGKGKAKTDSQKKVRSKNNQKT
jgi:hypothetical protein